MLAIVLGYTEKGPTAAPTVLYAGRDASAADVQSLTPPAGFIKTELIKHPIIQRHRHFAPIAEPVAEEPPAPEDPPAVEPDPEPTPDPEPELPVASSKKK